MSIRKELEFLAKGNLSINQLYNQTFYTSLIYSEIKSIIGDPKEFAKQTYAEQEGILLKLKEVLLPSKLINQNSLSKEIKDFDFMYKTFMSKKIDRKDSGEINNQLKLSIEFVIQYFFDQGFIDEIISSNQIISKIESDLILDLLFNTYVFSLSNVENVGERKFDIGLNEVKRIIFRYKLVDNLIIFFAEQVFKDNSRMSDVLSQLYYSRLPEFVHSSNKRVYIGCLFRLSNQLISLFVDVFQLKTRRVTYKDDTGKIKSVILLKADKRITEYMVEVTHIPQIIEPSNTYETFEDKRSLFKKVRNGISSVIVSNKTKAALKISQTKKFVINEKTVKVYQMLDALPYEEICSLNSLPFTPKTHLKFLEDKILQLEKITSLKLMKNLKDFYTDNKEKCTFYSSDDTILKKYGISQSELDNCNDLYWTRKDYESRLKLRMLHNTILQFAEIFNGFPIYFITFLDYRLRMYPFNFMFSRTSGNYKYLVMENKSYVDKKAIEIMILNYLKNYPGKIDDFNEIKNSLTSNKLVRWFNSNFDLNEIPKNKLFFYYYLLGLEIKDLVKNKYKTGYMLEIDQKSSSAVLLSIMFGDAVLAAESNLTSQKSFKDVSKFIMDKSTDWFKNKISNENHEIFSQNRNLHKSLFMGFTYNETPYGRRNTLDKYLTKNSSNDSQTISTEYVEFINSIFPSLIDKKTKFNAILKYYLDNCIKPIEIETLDGSVVSWQIFRKNAKKIKYLDPITGKWSSILIDTWDSNKRVNNHKILLGMIPSFIHSVDAAIMRLIILDMYEKSGYIINHLHDCVLFHPTKYNEVLNSITRVYTSNLFKNILISKFLNRLKNNLSEKHKEGFQLLINDLYDKNFVEIDINSENFNIENMFPFK